MIFSSQNQNDEIKGHAFPALGIFVCVCSVYRSIKLVMIPTSERRGKQWKVLFRFRAAWMNWGNSLDEGENDLLGASAKAFAEAGIASSVNAGRAGPAHSEAVP